MHLRRWDSIYSRAKSVRWPEATDALDEPTPPARILHLHFGGRFSTLLRTRAAHPRSWWASWVPTAGVALDGSEFQGERDSWPEPAGIRRQRHPTSPGFLMLLH